MNRKLSTRPLEAIDADLKKTEDEILRLLLRLAFALRFGERIHLRWRVNTLCLIHQTFDREDLDFGIGTTIDRTR